MKKTKFIANNYGKDVVLYLNQKVECSYYHEYNGEVESYQRSFLERIIDKPFTPVKLGVIVGEAGIHPYWLAGDGRKEMYLLVKFKEYLFAKPIPISCIYDAEFQSKRMESILKKNEYRVGEKGYSKQSFDMLKIQNDKLKTFLQQ